MPLPLGQEPPIREIEWEPEREFKAKQTVSIGTYVWPKTPFPYFFPTATLSPDEGKENKPVPDDPIVKKSSTPMPDDVADLETRTTIFVPTGFLPLKDSYSKSNAKKRRKIWGGGLVPPPDRVLTLSNSKTVYGRSRSKYRSSRGLQPPQRRRRIYTDDSDIFLCVLHSGFVTWSGLAKARQEKLDLKVDIRIIKVWGAKRAEDLVGSTPAGKEKDKKEEVITRFVGGIGERYFGGDRPVVKPLPSPPEPQAVIKIPEREEEPKMLIDGEVKFSPSMEDQAEDELESDFEDDGRSIESCSWGSGHDGSGIEIVGVEFVKSGLATKLSRQNRAQRLWEYAAQRDHLLPSKQIIGFKRKRDWDSGPPTQARVPNATSLSTIMEDEEEDEPSPSLSLIRSVEEKEHEAESKFSGGFNDFICSVQTRSQDDEQPPKKRKINHPNGKLLAT